MGGIGIVKNAYWAGDKGIVGIGYDLINMEIFPSPYEACWLVGQFVYLNAITPQKINNYWYTFHHWTHCLPSGELWDDYYGPSWSILVPAEFDYHRYTAYFTGGPYSVSLEFPNSGQFTVGDSTEIFWYSPMATSKGVDSTAVIDAYLDRHCGRTGYPEKILSNIPVKFWGSWWKVTGPASDSCKIKLVSHDCVENTASDTSDYWFTIVVPNISGDANSDGKIDLADAIYLSRYILQGGPAPNPLWKGDVNGDCKILLSDAILLARYVFYGSPAPWCNGSCWSCV